MNISVIVPAYNEEESLPELCRWVDKVMKEHQFSYEIWLIDDGSTDRSWEVIQQESKQNSSVKGIRFRRNYGKSPALHVGFEHAQGEVVITMDADLQDSPEEIPGLYRMISEEKYDLVSGWKKKRYDSTIAKNIPSKFFNAAARFSSGVKLHDFNCGLKAYRRDVVKSIEVFGEMHRYIPILAHQAGFKKIGEKVVQHQSRKYGSSKFGMSRFINGFLDLLTVQFITRFGKKPMHLFGSLGALFFLFGFGVLLELAIEKLFFHVSGIAQRPLFFFGILAFIAGMQLFLTGFLGELIGRSSADRNNYIIAEEAGV